MCPKNPPKREVNRHFQAELSKFKNCNVSETVQPISLKFDDETHTVNDTSWVVHHCRTWNTTWLTSAILKKWNVIIYAYKNKFSWKTANINVKKNCRFKTTFISHNWHILNNKNSFCDIKGHGYNMNCVLYAQPWRDRKIFCCFICVVYGPYALS